jgi:hypothetical protein
MDEKPSHLELVVNNQGTCMIDPLYCTTPLQLRKPYWMRSDNTRLKIPLSPAEFEAYVDRIHEGYKPSNPRDSIFKKQRYSPQ